MLTEVENGVIRPQAQGRRGCLQRREQGRAGRILPWSLRRGRSLLTPRFQTCRLQAVRKWVPVAIRPPPPPRPVYASLWSFASAARDTNTYMTATCKHVWLDG